VITVYLGSRGERPFEPAWPWRGVCDPEIVNEMGTRRARAQARLFHLFSKARV
jgi:hypothetical protein